MVEKAGAAGKGPSEAEAKEQVSLSLWIASYQNHVLFLSIFVALLSCCWNFHANDDGTSPVYTVANCVAVAILLLASYSEVSYMYQRHRLPPGDHGLPFFGNFVEIIRTGSEAFVIKRVKKYGSMFTHAFFGRQVVVMSDSEDVQWIMTLERKGRTYKDIGSAGLQKLLGEESIFLQHGAQHKRLRKIFEPAFTPMAIRDSVGTIDAIAQETLEEWAESGEWKTPRDWAVLAMRIFMTCAFGEADKEKLDRLTLLFEGWAKGFTAIFRFNVPGTALYKAHAFRKQLGDEMVDMMTAFKAENPPDSEAAQKSVMGRLCYATDDDGNPPTQEQLVDNLRFFLAAGFDTTKASFGAISHFMRENPHIEPVLVEEVQGLKEPLDIDELKHNAPVLNAVLAETWRLAAPLVGHNAALSEEEYYKGYVLPKGCVVVADIQGHAATNNKLHPRASEFCPERWLPKDHPLYDPAVANTEEIDYNVMNTKYRAFNMGPHMCLGGHFAKLEVRIVVARLFQKYCIETRNERIQKIPAKQILSEFKLTKKP